MEVELSPDQQARLLRMAEAQGLPVKVLVQTAVERLLDHDEWLCGEIDKGVSAADKGDLVEHDSLLRMIETRYPA